MTHRVSVTFTITIRKRDGVEVPYRQATVVEYEGDAVERAVIAGCGVIGEHFLAELARTGGQPLQETASVVYSVL